MRDSWGRCDIMDYLKILLQMNFGALMLLYATRPSRPKRSTIRLNKLPPFPVPARIKGSGLAMRSTDYGPGHKLLYIYHWEASMNVRTVAPAMETGTRRCHNSFLSSEKEK